MPLFFATNPPPAPGPEAPATPLQAATVSPAPAPEDDLSRMVRQSGGRVVIGFAGRFILATPPRK